MCVASLNGGTGFTCYDKKWHGVQVGLLRLCLALDLPSDQTFAFCILWFDSFCKDSTDAIGVSCDEWRNTSSVQP